MKILVTGKSGQLGSEINHISSSYNYNWTFTFREDFDLSDLENIFLKLDNMKPNIIINCAAYTSVDSAKDNFDSANAINNKSVALIAKWCYLNNCKLLHISTDYVYGSNISTEINEDYPTNPVNDYGITKLMGDRACIEANPMSIIIRTSWLYSSYGNNFVKKIIELMKIKKELNIVNDQIGSPTYAADLAQVIIKIINSKIWIPGIYNFSNKGKVSWYELANDIKTFYDFSDTIIKPISSKNYLTKAKRQNYSLLNNSKIKKNYNIIQENYKDSLLRCLKILKNES